MLPTDLINMQTLYQFKSKLETYHPLNAFK